MITAHIPSGYVAAKFSGAKNGLFWAIWAGAVFPDLDLIWFYFIDDRAFHHHHYWVHVPGFWILFGSVIWLVCRSFRASIAPLVVGFLAGITVHLCLDSIAGDIKWFWPFTDKFFHLVDIPARYDHWIKNFIFHPIFFLEVLIWVIAFWLWTAKRPNTPRARD